MGWWKVKSGEGSESPFLNCIFFGKDFQRPGLLVTQGGLWRYSRCQQRGPKVVVSHKKSGLNVLESLPDMFSFCNSFPVLKYWYTCIHIYNYTYIYTHTSNHLALCIYTVTSTNNSASGVAWIKPPGSTGTLAGSYACSPGAETNDWQLVGWDWDALQL